MGGPDAPRSIDEGADTAIWLACRSASPSDPPPTGRLWEDRTRGSLVEAVPGGRPAGGRPARPHPHPRPAAAPTVIIRQGGGSWISFRPSRRHLIM